MAAGRTVFVMSREQTAGTGHTLRDFAVRGSAGVKKDMAAPTTWRAVIRKIVEFVTGAPYEIPHASVRIQDHPDISFMTRS